jgi:cytochrome c oxidase subunit 3
MRSVTRLVDRKKEREEYAMEPKKFLLWVFLVTVTMLFAGLTSAIIVRKGDGNWQDYNIPSMFTYSTAIIILSSMTMFWAYFAARKNEILQNRIALWLTMALGILFVCTQLLGYKALIQQGTYLSGNPSGSFFYVISGLHLLHIAGGIFFLLATLISAYQYKVHSKNMLRINLCSTYWHFIGGLWVYLFVILNVLR